VLEMGRMKRSRMYDLAMDPEVPTFLAPRRRRLGIRERLDAKGHVLVPLHEADVRQAVEALRAQGVSAIAVCYLFSFLNPAHERRTRDLIAEVAPDMSVSEAHELARAITMELKVKFPEVSDVIIHIEPKPQTSAR